MRLALVLVVLLSLHTSAYAANNLFVYTASFYANSTCNGTAVQATFNDSSCTAFGSGQSVAWEIVNASYVYFLTWANTNCTGNASKSYYVPNKVCYKLDANSSVYVSWPLFFDISVSYYANNDTKCANATGPPKNMVSNYCYSYTGYSSIFYFYNYSTGEFCSWNQSGCPSSSTGSCLYAQNGACYVGTASGTTKFTWTTPPTIAYYEFSNNNCSGNFTSSHTYFDTVCAPVPDNSSNSYRLDIFNDANAAYYEWADTDMCQGLVALTYNFNNSQCLPTSNTTSSLAVWGNGIPTTSTTSQSSTTGATTASTSTTGSRVPDLFYYIYNSTNCTGTYESLTYTSGGCFETIGNTSQYATILNNVTVTICNYVGPTCGLNMTCSNLTNDQCLKSATQSYLLIWNSAISATTSSTTSSTSSTTSPSSTSTSSSSSSTSPTTSGITTTAQTTSTTSHNAAQRAGVRSVALILCALLLSIIFA